MFGRVLKYIFVGGLMAAMMVVAFVPSNAKNGSRGHYPSLQKFAELPGPDDDTTKTEGNAKFPLPKENVNPSDNTDNSPLYGSDPSNVSTSVEYDPETDSYNFQKNVDGMPIGTPYNMPFDDYVNYNFEKAMNSYWHQRAKKNREQNQEMNTNLIPHLEVGGEIFDRIFGGNVIDIKPQGSAELTLGLEYTRTDNPALDSKQQRQVNLDFDEKIQMNVVGQIGTKMKVNISYDTEASFDFENNVKLEYTGDDDDIIQKIEAGNVSLPLTGTLIQGSQSLFGVKTELKFGKLTLTGLLSQKKSETSTINVEGGSTTKEFEIKADNYEENKHFFLSHYFKENYDRSMTNLPVIMGGVTINRVEVWVTNKTGNYTDARNIVALVDLGESNSNDIQSMYVSSSLHNNTTVPPYNDVNILGNLAQDYPEIRDINTVSSTLQNLQMSGGTDFEKIESARKLNPSEYTLNAQLGYISLNSKLNADQVLAVAYEYTVNGEVFTVGEFSNSAIAAPQTLIVKLIKGTSFTPSKKNWDLMMKNIYNIGAYQITREDFTVDILYTNDKTGTDLTYIPAGAIDSIQLLRVMGLDNLNTNNDPYPDGMFDYVENFTISSSGGRIIFPVREPFGSYLYDKITGGNSALNNVADGYVFPELYDSTKSKAQQMAEKNKFKLKGRYKSNSSSEISLNAINVPQGSVSVTAGSTLLVENVDYTVDYNLGRVKILNQGILEAGTPISITLESNSVGSM
ncbi:MAG: cell surface protein SprA, partial [Bacteroidales bacterium]|nr:cell surface protein SprA [Bacteroidales bacterium]